MELSFDSGRFVSLDGDLNYREVLDDFPTAKTIRIITYNISKNQRYDALLEALKNTDADVELITNVPSRMDKYYDTNAGHNVRSNARKNINIYISKLNPDNFPGQFTPYFNIYNHAKMIGTENIVYIGSANYSNESASNIETGVLIEDKDFIIKLYVEFFDKVRKDSLSYFDENFSAFQLFILSLYAKFKHHHHKMLEDLYTDYMRTKMVVADSIFIDLSDLETLYSDLDELGSVCGTADDTYDEDNEDYNDALEQLKECFDRLSIDWLKETISEGGTLYQLVTFNTEEKANDILQEEYASVAWDEYLDAYVEKAMNSASEIYSDLHNAFQDESEDFLAEIEKILSALEAASCFTTKWKVSKVNPEIDNT
ncbi:phospholipase D-like domain-containing protein [Lacrimispora sp.]|uniref:phospholipase D-like domain-containing protein n=1 Tax=Lacrimispora sp. TaxID=2719234 RepID=UPI0039932708